jgi:hypothetical protein
MIATAFYKGQGLGNQLWAYAAIRSIARIQELEFGFLGVSNFKGHDFLDLDFGTLIPGKVSNAPKEQIPEGLTNYYIERLTRHPSGADISELDPLVKNANDGTFLDGTFQAEEYLLPRAEVASWLNTDGEVKEECVISLRGGEFRGVPELFLPQSYYSNAIREIRESSPNIKFVVVTDDASLARKWFPEFEIQTSGGVKRFHGGLYIHPRSHKIGLDFKRIQKAKYLILSNSSFSWWGAYSNLYAERIIAPKYWARYNTSDGFWSNGDSLTRGFEWMDRSGEIFDYEKCKREISKYKANQDRATDTQSQ